MVQKQFVRIDFVTGRDYPPVIGFDFGDFAILLVYDQLRATGGFKVYFEQEYKEYPSKLRHEFRWYSQYLADFTFKVSWRMVADVRAVFKIHEAVSYETLFDLLESFTPRDILPKFFKKR